MELLSDITHRKYIDSIALSDWEIETDTGWEEITHIHKTVPYQKWKIVTDQGLFLVCADTHILFDVNFEQIYVKDITEHKTYIQTRYGAQLVIVCKITNDYDNMFDVSVNSSNHRFYSNDIISHNSSPLCAICFALFGKPYRNINKPQLINSITNKNLVTEIEFDVGSASYKIVRGMKPAIFNIYKNNELVNQTAEIKDYQEYLEKNILKMTYKSFCQTVILGSANYIPFMLLSAQQRRDFIEDLLDLQIFSTMNLLLKEKVQTNKNTLISLTSELKIQQNKQIVLQNLKQSLEIDKQTKISTAKSKIKTSTKEIKHIQDQIEKNLNRINELAEQSSDILLLLEQKTKFGQHIIELEKKRKRVDKEIAFYETNNVCPTCNQEIDEQHASSTIESKKDILQRLEEYDTKLNSKLGEIVKEINKTEKLNNEIQALTEKIQQFEAKKNIIISTISSLEKELVDINDEVASTELLNIEDVEQEIKELEEQIQECYKEREIINAAGILLKDGGIKTKIIKQYIPVINGLINKYLAAMDFFVSFVLDEQFKETVKSRNRDLFTYASFSEGEKMRINLALLFTWRAISKTRNKAATNLLIFDEIGDSSLDETGLAMFNKIIRDIGANVIIISHNQAQNTDAFDRVLLFKKTKNFTSYEVL